MREIILIAAAGDGNELGREGELPWHLPDDFRRFKQLTSGHPILMGRKTFETFPKPLPNRLHLIITRDRNFGVDHPSCRVVHSLEEALEAVADRDRVFVIGGGEIYRQALPFATLIELTRVHGRFPADTYFPEFDPACWEQVASEDHPADARHDYSFTFQTFRKRC
ncbi:MAG TPA: dihydrofolate reductase [Robiginitalea sp.]|nr:dihydrofolate reductase [Robiginitalea sp.]